MRKFEGNETSLGGVFRIEGSVIIHKSATELFEFWRDLENLPRIMKHLKSVEIIDQKQSYWKAGGPAGTTLEWEAGVIDEKENEFISWRSLKNSQIENAGSVSFIPTVNGRGTEVKVRLCYNPPGGALGDAIAKIFGKDPADELEEDLERFKNLMESEKIARGQYPEEDTDVIDEAAA